MNKSFDRIDPKDKHTKQIFKLSKNKFYGIKVLGKGGYGKVFLVRSKSGKEYALKELKQIGNTDGLNFLYLREVSILKELDHPNVIKLIQWNYSPRGKKLNNNVKSRWKFISFVRTYGRIIKTIFKLFK
jgi:serine/threonine protein kinase